MEVIAVWYQCDPEYRGKYPIEGNVALLEVQDLRAFENLVKVWSDNVPVQQDAKAMKTLRDHRMRLALEKCSSPE